MDENQTTDLPPTLGKTALRVLAEAGYTQLEQVARVAEVELLGLHGFEPKAMEQLRAALDERGLTFAAASDFPTTLGKPALRALATAGYTRLEQLSRTTEAELLALHGMGPKGVRLLREALGAQGISFAAPDKG